VSTALRTYIRGNNLVSMIDHQANQKRIYHFDHQGTTQCLTDATTGAVTDRFAADAWGVPVKRTGTSLNRQWYVGNWGSYGKLETCYLRDRYYRQVLASFLATDSASEQGGGRYVYCGADPVAYVDPGGMRREKPAPGRTKIDPPYDPGTRPDPRPRPWPDIKPPAPKPWIKPPNPWKLIRCVPTVWDLIIGEFVDPPPLTGGTDMELDCQHTHMKDWPRECPLGPNAREKGVGEQGTAWEDYLKRIYGQQADCKGDLYLHWSQGTRDLCRGGPVEGHYDVCCAAVKPNPRPKPTKDSLCVPGYTKKGSGWCCSWCDKQPGQPPTARACCTQSRFR
jgi:RHS repeat-associated protein